MALLELDRFGSLVVAELARLRLEAAGIDSVIFDSGVTRLGLGIAVGGIRLMVEEQDRPQALRVLSEPGVQVPQEPDESPTDPHRPPSPWQ